MQHSGKHAFVTGGGTGIGLAIARALASEGAEVTITGRRQEVLDQVAGGRIHAMVMDVTDEAAQIDTISRAVAERGPIQICIANAGIAEGKTLQKTDLEFWQKIIKRDQKEVSAAQKFGWAEPGSRPGLNTMRRGRG